MRVLISGSSGLVGTALRASLAKGGHEILRLVRHASSAKDEVAWDPASGRIEAERLGAIDAVVHLAGENIARGRWTASKMERIRASRVDGTRGLCRALAELAEKPGTLVSASAIGYYGDRGQEELTEDSARGSGFLADVCAAWEAACEPARAAGIRVVHPRIGVVLSGEGGALAAMLPPFKLGLGGRMGDGRQIWSWITLDDLVSAIEHVLVTPALEGPVNAVSPHPVTNAGFTRALGRVLSRPTILPMPAPVARLVLGKMADGLILASAHVLPRKLEQTGFRCAHAEIEPALRHVLGRPGTGGTS